VKNVCGFCATFLLCAAGFLSIFLMDPSAVSAQDAAPSGGASIVKASSYVSLDRVPRAREFQVAVVVNIASGFHMNSHKPTDAYLIPTTLTPQLPAGFTLTDIVYPAGHPEKFAFSPNQPLDVYTGAVTLRMKLAAQTAAPLGHATIPMVLRYQACNQTTCLPPVKVPVGAEVQVVEAGGASHPVHAEIFRP
jgi:DsbC/DsbD-like thiol-disulfide interchange protein